MLWGGAGRIARIDAKLFTQYSPNPPPPAPPNKLDRRARFDGRRRPATAHTHNTEQQQPNKKKNITHTLALAAKLSTRAVRRFGRSNWIQLERRENVLDTLFSMAYRAVRACDARLKRLCGAVVFCSMSSRPRPNELGGGGVVLGCDVGPFWAQLVSHATKCAN